MSKVGFVGLGNMGKPMAKNLLKAGVDLMVCDLNEEAVEEMKELGATSGTYAVLGAQCDVIFMIIPYGEISKNIIFGGYGLASTLSEGNIICDMSSITPVEAKDCHDRLAKFGIKFVDAPVSGGEEGAIDGSLAFMVGGAQEDFDALKPYFDIMGSSAVLVGDSGSGAVTILANQIIVNNTIATISEAFVLTTKAGADPMKVYEAIKGGLAASAVLDSKLPRIVNRDFKAGGKIYTNDNDLRNVVNTAHTLNVPVPLSAQLYEIMQTLIVQGHKDEDHGGIVQYFEHLANVEVKKVEE